MPDKYNAVYPIGSLSSSSGEELLRCEYKRSLYSYRLDARTMNLERSLKAVRDGIFYQIQ